MERLKFSVVSIIILVLFVLGGYWAVNTIESGSEYVSNQKLKALQDENESLKKEIEALSQSQSSPKEVVEDPKPVEQPAPTPTPKPTPAKTTYKNQTLINELQKLVDKGVTLELKSTGPAVGTVQKFLNIYNKTSNKIDNDFGVSTKNAVIAFQKAQGLTADGGVGSSTLKKMIAWLKKQG